MTEHASGAETSVRSEPSSVLVLVLAIATSALVANLYYAQPLIGTIGAEIGVSPDFAGSLVSVTQLGYGIGLILIVSLADIVENKRLVLFTLTGTVAALVVIAMTKTGWIFVVASLVMGVCSAGAQILLPYTAHLVPEERRGRVIGNVMAAVLTGIMLARPVSLFVSASWGWRSIFWMSAALISTIGLVLVWIMPKHVPQGGISYGQVLSSLSTLFRRTPALRRRAIYQSLMFAAFAIFWTAAPPMLSERIGMSQHAIALFALAGAGGALAAPFAGHLADRGWVGTLTVGAVVTLALSFLFTPWAVDLRLVLPLLFLTVLIDAAVQVNQVVGQRVIFTLPAATRGRINAIYMTVIFLGGAVGSTLSTVAYHSGGWNAIAGCGVLIGIVLMLIYGAHHHADKIARRAELGGAE